MAHVSRSVTLNVSASELWDLIGGFHGLPGWHPAVADSAKEIIDGIEHRRLSLEGGGEILEKLLGNGPMSLGYSIEESPLPVTDYRSTLTVADAGGKSVVVWASTFEPTADGAEDVIAGIYEAGFGALVGRFES